LANPGFSDIKDEPRELTALEKENRSHIAAFGYGVPKVRKPLEAGIRPLSAIVATTGLYDWSLMPSYATNGCPEEKTEEEKERELAIINGVTPKPASPTLPASFKTSNEIAHAMNIAFAKAGLIGQKQQLGESPGPKTYLGLMQTHAAESGSLPSGRYPPAAYHTALLNATASGSQTKHLHAQAVSLPLALLDPTKSTTGEMVAVNKLAVKRRPSISASASASSSEPKAKRTRKSTGGMASGNSHEKFIDLDKLNSPTGTDNKPSTSVRKKREHRVRAAAETGSNRSRVWEELEDCKNQ
jgi:hypothetical protein